MLKIVEKYISFDGRGHSHMKSKVEKCKTIHELNEVLTENKFIVSWTVINNIKAELGKNGKDAKSSKPNKPPKQTDVKDKEVNVETEDLTKKELYNELLAKDFTKDDLKGLNKTRLQELYDGDVEEY